MNRRDLLRASAAAVGGSAASLALVSAGADRADAQTALTLDVVGDSATLGADESLASVTLSVDVEWAYDLPDSASPSTVIVELAAGTDSVSVVDSAESAELFTEAEGSESFDVDLLGTDALDTEALTPDSGERETSVTVEARLRVESSGGKVLARETASDTATLTVERDSVSASEYGAVGGSGSLTIEVE